MLRPGSAGSRRRVARHLLGVLARDSGGLLLEVPPAGPLLLAAPEAVLEGALTALLPLFGRPALGWAEQPPPGAVAAGTVPPTAADSPAASPLELFREPIMGLVPGGLPRLAGLRMGHRGPTDAPPALHAAEAAALTLAATLEDEEGRAALLGGAPGVPLHLDAPGKAAAALSALPLPVLPVLPPDTVLGVLPPGPFALGGLEAATLELCALRDLPGAALHLCWSPALAALAPRLAATLDPGRLVLDGVDGEAALAWGLAQGIGRFSGAHPSRLLAATRRRNCSHRAGCSAAQCLARAEGTTATARAGCHDPARLLHEVAA
ncbi:hypothetical protein [Roseomonas elaeocarpi]|uniref:Uncharacterized protein n=1 Tax=Roseomonas elaeocarpi TaxID=907779 RepID=A0ABV6JSG5_9PROT